MAHPRFFVEGPIACGARLLLPEEVAHHAVRVLRMKSGDDAVIFNGLGGEYHGRLEFAADAVSFQVIRFDAREAELGFAVRIGQGLCATDKMDWLVEKAVEFGAAQLTPLALARSVVRLSDERAQKRLRHWQRLSTSACEQCGRNRLMHVLPVADLASWASHEAQSLSIVLAANARTSLAALARASAPCDVRLLIGPEGGLTESEVADAARLGFIAAHLGPRILRTESAAMLALATLAACWDA